MSFWNQLAKPFFILAPMEDVTDTVFRQVISKAGRPEVFYTEFTNVEGVQSVGQAKVIHRLKYLPSEQPIVAQVWGKTPDDYYKTAQLIESLGFAGIDINMGCPVKKVIQLGACSALIKNHSLAKEIVDATRRGAPNLPLSIKTRIGFNTIDTENWIGFLLRDCYPEALVIHGRTVKEESKAPCHWDEIGKAVLLRDQIQQTSDRTLIIGNGDVTSRAQGVELSEQYGLDGIMIGRGVFHNPWVFDPIQNTKTIQDRIELLLFHLELWNQTWGQEKNYQSLKKFFKIYIQGFESAASLRSQLMETSDLFKAKEILINYLSKNN